MNYTKQGKVDKRYKLSLADKELLFWRNHGVEVIAGLLGFLAGTIITQTLWNYYHQPIVNPKASGEVKRVKEVVAVETPYCYDAVTCIRDIGEEKGFSNKEIMTMIRIARCESNFDQYAKNPYSTAKGIFQFIDSTWRSNCLKDGNVYDFEDNIRCAWKVYARQSTRPWNASKSCWNQ